MKISELMDEVLSLPRDMLRPGIPLENRGREMELLARLVPDFAHIKKGCLPKNDTVEVRVRIHKTEFCGYHEILLFRHVGKDVLTFDGTILHLKTVEEVHQYISKLCSENAY